MRKLNPTLFVLCAAALIGIGFGVDNEYYLGVATLMMINALNTAAFNVLLGYGGVISMGQAAFYGIGAYVAAVLSVNYGVPPAVTLLIAPAMAFVVAWIVGYPVLKLHGHYLAMATLGFGMIVYIFMNEFSGITGGPSGFMGIGNLSFLGFELATEKSFYIFMSTFFLICVLLYEVFDKSFLHYKLKFIKNSESACRSYGINVTRTKLMVFASVAAITALNGVLYTYYTHFISPVSFSFKYSISLVCMATVGGLGYISGGIVGAVFLGFIPEVFATFEDFEMIIYGGLLAVVIMFFPGGIAGTLKKLVRKNAQNK
ncbi:inner-membrane translocator [Denitrovibrio acetiphilus DSM 12809]|uniref:Inner-membrane translocator n=1 Tax=Denitrovibrio acetiphilus (strain DSM 12809 / NBRC 114555 / N2460) TaxID=522772 RepID=D4H0X5_DENA2|nr:branched-chain amino acid ABC transporter permease [Denitrovibrio acetiphilus]ADD68638.1 inner-membrane translocator [Denitrovibrio acetiphilus DSM 12809]